MSKPLHAMTPVDAVRCEGVTVRAHASGNGLVRVDASRQEPRDAWGWYVSPEHANGKLVVTEKLSQQELANMVGASREMVNRIRKDLTDRGCISIESKAITIINREFPPSL